MNAGASAGIYVDVHMCVCVLWYECAKKNKT